jgi:protein-L-isoaspartate O-methyltransferase
MYLKVNDRIASAGGRWDRRRKAHIFKQNPRELFTECGKVEKSAVDTAAVIENGVKPEIPGFFPTPPELAARMVELSGVKDGQCVLEPSAGDGALVAAVLAAVDTEVLAYEIDSGLCKVLRDRFPSYHCQVRQRDFLTVTDFMGQYPIIIMNPPFENAADIDHIRHAADFLAPGGRLVAICAGGPRQERELRPMCDTWERLPAGTFKSSGTMVNTVLLTIDN